MAVKMKTTVTLRAEAECPSHSLAQVRVRDLAQIIDEPTERNGTNLGFAPTDTALSALAGCTNTIAHKCAKSLGVDIGHLHVSVACQFDRRGVTLSEEIETPFQSINLKVVADGSASADDLARVAAEVSKYCPLAKLFRNAGTEINEEWTMKT